MSKNVKLKSPAELKPGKLINLRQSRQSTSSRSQCETHPTVPTGSLLVPHLTRARSPHRAFALFSRDFGGVREHLQASDREALGVGLVTQHAQRIAKRCTDSCLLRGSDGPLHGH